MLFPLCGVMVVIWCSSLFVVFLFVAVSFRLLFVVLCRVFAVYCLLFNV